MARCVATQVIIAVLRRVHRRVGAVVQQPLDHAAVSVARGLGEGGGPVQLDAVEVEGRVVLLQVVEQLRVRVAHRRHDEVGARARAGRAHLAPRLEQHP